jgi:cytochrome c-type biogenesis protein
MIPSMFFGGAATFLDMNGLIALLAGFLSFFSPCVLPLVPSYLIFISGITFDHYTELKSAGYRKIVLIHSLAFVLGFSVIFVALGLSSSVIGVLLISFQKYIVRLGGLFLILMGLFTLNIIRIPFLNYEKAIHLKEKPVGLAGSFLVGITFCLGWTPCVGPALASILILASASDKAGEGAILLGFYSLGMAVPFILSAFLVDRLFVLLRKYGHIVRYTTKVLGILLLVLGLLLVTGYYGLLTAKLGALFPVSADSLLFKE